MLKQELSKLSSNIKPLKLVLEPQTIFYQTDCNLMSQGTRRMYIFGCKFAGYARISSVERFTKSPESTGNTLIQFQHVSQQKITYLFALYLMHRSMLRWCIKRPYNTTSLQNICSYLNASHTSQIVTIANDRRESTQQRDKQRFWYQLTIENINTIKNLEPQKFKYEAAKSRKWNVEW